MKLDVSSLAHTKWECKYHIVFAPKYRRQIIYGKIKQDIGQMLRKLCEYKGIEIHEAEACKDHIHMLVSIPPKYSVSQIMGYLKGKSSLMIYEKYANLKYKYGNRHRMDDLIAESVDLTAKLTLLKKEELKRIQGQSGSTKVSMVYLNMVQEAQNVVSFTANLLKVSRKFQKE